MTRREWMAAASALPLTLAAARRQTAPLTADTIVERIRRSVGTPWRDRTVDGFKAGNPTTPITGVATSTMATFDVLRQAASHGQNLIVVQEPTFYTADDAPGARAADPVYLAKTALIDEHRLVVWRFTEHWMARRPNPAVVALAARLGWRLGSTAGTDQVADVGEMSFGELVSVVRQRLGLTGGVRIVGRPSLRVRRVYLSPGTADLASTVSNLARADVVLAGEPREWEAVPYTLDTWFDGRGEPKGLMSIGRVVSDAPGAEACAEWLRSIVPEVPVAAILTPNPYWSPLT
jgi:putative NIF3 family GTP cyclohydrolase 1 type 2